MKIYRDYIKRGMDIAIAGAGLAVLSLPMLGIGAAIRIEDKGPVLFKQDRIGQGGKVFKMYKFRSMKTNSEHSGSGVYSDKNDSRVTRVGKVLRATSMDELPQLINMLKGNMSLIGPRPPLTYHPWPIENYTAEQLKMFEVRPGITGWAQVNGRRAVMWNDRIKLNNWYVDNESFKLDAKIFFMTIAKVLKGSDNENTGATIVPSPGVQPDGAMNPSTEEDA